MPSKIILYIKVGHVWRKKPRLAYFVDVCPLGCPRFCQKLKIQKVTPLRFWIGSNGFQKVQKLENLCMLEGALTHIYVYEANSLKRIIRRRCFYLKIRLPLLQMTSTQKIIFKGSSNLQKNFGSKFWHQGPMISNNLNMAI